MIGRAQGLCDSRRQERKVSGSRPGGFPRSSALSPAPGRPRRLPRSVSPLFRRHERTRSLIGPRRHDRSEEAFRREPLQHRDLRIPVLEALHQSLDLLEPFSAGRAGFGKMPAGLGIDGEQPGDVGELQMLPLAISISSGRPFTGGRDIRQSQISLYDQGHQTVPDAVLERTAKAAGFPVFLLPFLLRAIRGFRLLAGGRWADRPDHRRGARRRLARARPVHDRDRCRTRSFPENELRSPEEEGARPSCSGSVLRSRPHDYRIAWSRKIEEYHSRALSERVDGREHRSGR